ncbi:hypothetical protein BHM03_00011684 [Ensete ventricosum]|nr:hypothetical protein BHM03_00011684 [Ensete ventricosum]
MASDLHLDDVSALFLSFSRMTLEEMFLEAKVAPNVQGKPKVEESGPAFFEIILHLYQEELEAAKSEIQKWHSAFQNGPATPAGTSPGLYLLHNKFVPWSAVRDLKTQLRPPSMQFITRKLLLDPAIHEEFTRLKNLVEEKEKKIKELQDNLAAVNFTASSKLGKMLMAKSLFRHMEGLTNEMERSNEMVMCLLVYILQERLEAKDCELRKLELLSQKEAAEERDDDDGDKEEANEGNSADVEA